MEEKINEKLAENITGAGVVLPMVALRGKVIFPGVITSFDVGRKISLSAIDVAANNSFDIFVAAQKDSGVDNPSSQDVYSVGVVCRIRQIVKMPGNNARVTIRGEGEERPLLLVVKDSYFHSLAPFLARHFDLDLIDPRYYNESVARLIEEEKPAAVLILCGLDTVTDSAALSKLALGLGR